MSCIMEHSEYLYSCDWLSHVNLQHKTMQMIYETIYKALVDVGLEEAESPQDYLNFFCLGSREDTDPKDDSLFDYSPEVNSHHLCE